MAIDKIQFASVEGGVSPHPEQENQVSAGGDSLKVHEADDFTTSPEVGASQDARRAAGKDVLDELPAGSSYFSRTALVGPMTPSGLDARLLEKAPLPPSTSDCMAGFGNQAEDRSIHQKLALILAHLEVLTKPIAPSVVDTPATAPEPEAVSVPAGPTTPVSEPHLTVSATRRKWKHCPDLVFYVKGTTLQIPRSDLDIQDAIRVDTGYAPSLPAIQNRIWKLAEEGKIDVYVRNSRGDMIPYRARRSKFKLYIVWTEAVNCVSQPTPLIPKPTEKSPAPGGGGPLAERTQDGLAPPSSLAATLDAAPDPVPEAATHEMPLPPKGLARWLRQLGIRNTSISTER